MRLGKKKFRYWVVGLLAAVSIFGCHDSSSDSDSTDRTSEPLEPPPLSEAILSSAASFLGAAAGKEQPLSVDSIVFINTAMGINDIDRDPQDLYGDLWVLLRNENGEPILDTAGCVQPVASEPVTWPDSVVHSTVPMVLEEFQDGEFKCSVVEGYEAYTIELEIGRMNMVRNMINNPDNFGRALKEAIDNINAAVSVDTDPAGRLVLTQDDNGTLVEATIDSPRENLALYYALMKYGRIAGYGPTSHEGGVTVPPQWLELRSDLDLGALSYLRDGVPGRDTGVGLINGYADLRTMTHNRRLDYQSALIGYIQYIDGASCPYWDMKDLAFERVFASEPYEGTNIAAFTAHADDTRRLIVFMHDVIQDLPDEGVAAMPTPAGNRVDLMKAAATFLGAASNKSVPLTVDGLVFINTVLGLNEAEFNNKGELYGDLWQLLRNEDGEPLLDGNSCPQPVASQTIVWPDGIERDTVPMVLDEQGECTVVEGYEDYVVELELGRLNGVRVALTNPKVLHRHLYDVVNSLNAAVEVKLDVAGRLTYGLLEDGELNYYTVDSPRAGLALYWALMKWGKLEGTIDLMVEGSWTPTAISLTLDDAILDAEGLGYLKHGSATCQSNPQNCGSRRLPSGFVDYRDFSHSTQNVFGGVMVNYVERQDDPLCPYTSKTDDVWQRVLGSDPYSGTNIGAFVKLAEDTRNTIHFIHTVIQEP